MRKLHDFILALAIMCLLGWVSSLWAVDITLTFSVSMADKARIVTAIEQAMPRIQGETDLQLFKRYMKLKLSEIVIQSDYKAISDKAIQDEQAIVTPDIQ